MEGRQPLSVAATTVLVVDDSGYARTRLKRFLLESGFARVVEAANGDEAVRSFFANRPRLVLLDQVMRGQAGIEAAKLLLARDRRVDIVMLTVVTDRSFHEAALGAGIRRVLAKADYAGLAQTLRELGYE